MRECGEAEIFATAKIERLAKPAAGIHVEKALESSIVFITRGCNRFALSSPSLAEHVNPSIPMLQIARGV